MATRGQRFTDFRKLRDATRAACAQKFEELAGYPWNDGDKRALLDDLSEPEALDVWREVERAVVHARDFLRLHPTADDGYAMRLRRFVAMLPEVTGETRFHWTRRKLLVLEFDRVGHWWWRDRPPKPRELAILSILAGEFPDIERGRPTTILEAVAAEERAIRRAQGELAKATARDVANRTRVGLSAVSS